MPIDERDRIRFHGWLLQHDLDEEVADAILATMPPYDWHELATKADLGLLEQRTDHRFDIVDMRLDGLDRRIDDLDRTINGRIDDLGARSDARFDHVERRLAGMSQEIRAILFTLIGLIVSVLLAGAGAVFG